MNNISVVTVTYNNAAGLKITLESLNKINEKPFEIIIIDANSKDNTKEIVEHYSSLLNIKYICERDNGIYDAMNKGCHSATGSLIHYLNAGDTVSGDVYLGINEPCRLNVILIGDNKKIINKSKVTHNGYGYCHQGVIFPSKHKSYNTKYKIAADLDALMYIFPQKILMLPVHREGNVFYDMSGVSSNKRLARDLEIAKIFVAHKKYFMLVTFIISSVLKYPIPKFVRRSLRKYI